MLVLSRKRQQRFFIGNTVEVMILEIRGGNVKLGILAPRDIQVTRPDAKKKRAPKSRNRKES
jgi:carbon storage regulator